MRRINGQKTFEADCRWLQEFPWRWNKDVECWTHISVDSTLESWKLQAVGCSMEHYFCSITHPGSTRCVIALTKLRCQLDRMVLRQVLTALDSQSFAPQWQNVSSAGTKSEICQPLLKGWSLQFLTVEVLSESTFPPSFPWEAQFRSLESRSNAFQDSGPKSILLYLLSSIWIQGKNRSLPRSCIVHGFLNLPNLGADWCHDISWRDGRWLTWGDIVPL